MVMNMSKVKFSFILITIVIVILAVLTYKKVSQSSSSDKKINTIYIATTGEPKSLDPQKVDSTWERYIINDIFTGLFTRSASGEVIPGLAQKWEVKNNNKTYIFTLKESYWSDGEPLTAEDFEYAFKRLLNPQTASTYASYLFMVKGAKDFASGKTTEDTVAVKALDNKTLRVDLEYPAPYFINSLSHFSTYPVPKHVVEKYGNDWSKTEHIVTNGAYIPTSWRPQNSITAIKNPNFYEESKVRIENIVYYTQEDRSALLKRFRANEIDVLHDFSSDQYEWIKQNLESNLVVSKALGTYYYTINSTGKGGNSESYNDEALKALKNPKVRTALNLAIDRSQITDAILKSGEIPSYSFIPQNMSGYIPVEYSWKSMTQQQRITLAKKLMQEAGFTQEHPLHLQLSYDTAENDKKIAVAVASMWKNIGVVTSIFNTEINIHYANMEAQHFHVGKARWVADYDEPSNFLMLGTKGAALNYSGYYNPEFEKDLNLALNQKDKNARNKLYRKAETLLLDDSSILPIYSTVNKKLVSSRVKGWQANSSDTNLTQYLSLQ